MMKRYVGIIFMLLFIPLAFSYEYNPMAALFNYVKYLFNFASGLFSGMPKVNITSYIIFGIILLLITFAVAYIVHHMTKEFLKNIGIEGNEQKVISTLIAILVGLLILAQPQIILAAVLMAIAPLGLLFLLIIIFGLPLALGLETKTFKKVFGFLVFFIMLIIFVTPTIESYKVKMITGKEFETELVAPSQVVEAFFGKGAASLFVLLLVILMIISLVWGKG